MISIPATPPSEVQHALDQAERSVAATGQALLHGDPGQLQLATHALHDSVQALALVLRTRDSGGALRGRLMRIARDIAMQREALLRRSAAVDRCVQSLLPQQAQHNTYADGLGRYGARGVRRPIFGSL